MDATRLSSRELVAIKSFLKQGQELHIAQFFTSVHDPRNHCVSIYEILPDPYDPKLAMMVMPYLRPCNNPEFATLGDVVDFIDQTIEVRRRYDRRPVYLTLLTGTRLHAQASRSTSVRYCLLCRSCIFLTHFI